MNNVLFSDRAGIYMLLDYYPTHSQLLIRRKMDKTIEHNVDLVFKSVVNLRIPTRFDGITVTFVDASEYNSLSNLNIKTEFEYKIFKLEDNHGVVSFINAGVFGVFHNKLNLLDTSLGDILDSQNNICIYWSAD